MLLSRSLRVLVVGLCVVLGAATAFAAATLEVTVIGGSGRVTVVVTGPDGVAQTTNYNQQEFKVPVAGPAAAYEVSITVGDVTETTEIPLPAKGKVNVVFIVEPGPPRIEATTVAVETLTVTARRIEESLQEVPLSVSAVSGETLDEAGIDRMEEYLTRVPSTTVFQYSEAETTIQMRGVSAVGGDSNTVSTYVDDTPITSSPGTGTTLRSFDVERIEVLRGPQGTLFGEGSMGGAVRLIQNKPTAHAFDGVVELDAGSIDGGGITAGVNLMLNMPVVRDKFALRLVGIYRDSDGWVDMPNLIDGPEEDTNTAEVMNFRLSGRWFASDRLIVDASVTYNDTHLGGTQISTKDGISERLNKEPYDDEYLLGNLTFTFDFDWATLVSSTSYWDREGLLISDLGWLVDTTNYINSLFFDDPPEITNLWASVPPTTEQFTQEFRLSSTGSGSLMWTAGLFYKDSKDTTGTRFITEPDITDLYGEYFLIEGSDSFEQLAVFGEVNYRFADKFEAVAGARLFREDRTTHVFLDGYFWYIYGVEPPEEVEDSATYNEVLPKFSLKWDVASDSMVYVTAAKGFRSGGINVFSPPDEIVFNPDFVWNYEIGAKTGWLENRLVLNGALFYMDWQDIQIGVPSLNPGMVSTINAGSAHTSGLELELTAQPTAGLSFGVSAGWIFDAETDDNSAYGPAGTELTDVPEYNANFFAGYRFPLSVKLNGVVNANYNMVGESRSLSEFESSPDTFVNEAYQLLNLNLGVETQSWRLTLFVDNATDEFVQLLNLTDYGEPGHSYTVPPRTIGLRFRTNF